MSEFDLNAAINEAELLVSGKKNAENRTIPIVMSTQSAMPLAVFLSAVNFSRGLTSAKLDLDPEVRSRFQEDVVAVFSKKLDDALGDLPEPKVHIDVSRHELDKLGEFLVMQGPGKKQSANFTHIKDYARASFLLFNWEFVKSGGEDNFDLIDEIKNLMKK